MRTRSAPSVIVASLMLAASMASAADYQFGVEITPPTEYTDGTPLDPAKDIKEYRIYAVGSGDLILGGIQPAGEGVVKATLKISDTGCQTIAATAVSAEGLESGLSPTIEKCVRVPMPVTMRAGPLVRVADPAG